MQIPFIRSADLIGLFSVTKSSVVKRRLRRTERKLIIEGPKTMGLLRWPQFLMHISLHVCLLTRSLVGPLLLWHLTRRTL